MLPVPSTVGEFITISNRWHDTMVLCCKNGHLIKIPLNDFLALVHDPNDCELCPCANMHTTLPPLPK